jgi:hypothetical protein
MDFHLKPINMNGASLVVFIFAAQSSVRLSRLTRQATASFATELSPIHDHLALTPVRAAYQHFFIPVHASVDNEFLHAY